MKAKKIKSLRSAPAQAARARKAGPMRHRLDRRKKERLRKEIQSFE